MPIGDTAIYLSAPTVGDTAAATYRFMTRGYKPPMQARSINSDQVHNQNDLFIYVYDNGPGARSWRPFNIICDDKFSGALDGSSATQQYGNLVDLWNRIGEMQLSAPDGTRTVRWATGMNLEPDFVQYPKGAGDKIAYVIAIQLEEM